MTDPGPVFVVQISMTVNSGNYINKNKHTLPETNLALNWWFFNHFLGMTFFFRWQKAVSFFRENLSPRLPMGKKDRKSSEIPTGERPNLSLFGRVWNITWRGLNLILIFSTSSLRRRKVSVFYLNWVVFKLMFKHRNSIHRMSNWGRWRFFSQFTEM